LSKQSRCITLRKELPALTLEMSLPQMVGKMMMAMMMPLMQVIHLEKRSPSSSRQVVPQPLQFPVLTNVTDS
jgi:hypothetical protein